ncbi:unnamed protein product [Colias eurytheme]|nr:unnamed protein product [Colias eurytheme]
MADTECVEHPTEVQQEEKEVSDQKENDSVTDAPQVPIMTNAITVPDNCPPGFSREMADNENVEQPIEVEEEVKEVQENESEDKSEETLTSRNVVSVPSNCPAGYVRGADGVCRQVF